MMSSQLARFSGRAIVCTRLSTDFQSATEIVPIELAAATLKPHQVIVRNHWVGVNASDVNFTAGKYLGPGAKLPLRCGFEAVSEVVAVGSDANVSPGDPVAISSFGAFADYQVVNSSVLLPLPSLDPSYLPLVVSGLTASIGLKRVGEIKSGDVVLVTAAAGGTGQFAVQLAKAVGCTVIGTCSSPAKAALLRRLGCDRPVNTSTESLDEILRAEFPSGVDVVYESVGGETFTTAARHLAKGGRLVVIGFISGYLLKTEAIPPPSGHGQSSPAVDLTASDLSISLLSRSASVRGFFLPHFVADVPEHFADLVRGVQTGQLSCGLDERCAGGEFEGLGAVGSAVEYLYSRQSAGKVFVSLDASSASKFKQRKGSQGLSLNRAGRGIEDERATVLQPRL